MSLPFKVATACYLRKEGKTLLIDYTNYPHPIHAGKYAAPGGRLEEGELMDDCVKREIAEEQGLLLHSVIWRGMVRFLNEERTINGKPMKHNFDVHIYDCFDFDDARMNPKEGVPVWVDNARVLDLPLHEGDRIIWRDWLSKYKQFGGLIEHKGDKLTSARLTATGAFIS